MSQPYFRVMHSFESGRSYFVQVKTHRRLYLEAMGASDRRALEAGWDPAGKLDLKTASESRNWLTFEASYLTPLSIARALQIGNEQLGCEADLLLIDAQRARAMTDKHREYQVKKNPLFAAMGALDEVWQEVSPSQHLRGLFDRAMVHEVADAAREQECFRFIRQFTARFGAEVTQELTAYAKRTYPNNSGNRISFWRDVMRDPEARIDEVRKLSEQRRQNDLRFGRLRPDQEPEG